MLRYCLLKASALRSSPASLEAPYSDNVFPNSDRRKDRTQDI